MGKSGGLRALTNFIAWLALILIAVSLVLSKLNFASNVCVIFNKIASYVAYFLVGFSSLCYVMSKRSILKKIIWLVAVGMIVTTMFI